MPRVWLLWNQEHDTAGIYWDQRPMDFPITAMNKAAENFYNQEPPIYPYYYAVWRDGTEIGLLMTGAMNLEPDSAEEVLFSILNQLIERGKLEPDPDPDYEMKVFDA